MAPTFLDSNILLYTRDSAEPEKKAIAARLMRSLGPDAVISTQVLQEFYSVGTRKLKLAPFAAREAVLTFSDMEVVTIRPRHVLLGMDYSISHQLNFWDALIVAAAESAGCVRIYTEDFNDGQEIRGIRIENPFRGP